MTDDNLTVLHSVNRRHATKRITRNPKTGEIKNRSYDREHHFRVEIVPVGNFADLCTALTRFTEQPFAFVIRGEPAPGINPNYTRRLLHPDHKSGDPATFTAAPRHWFAVDMDHIAAPVTIDPVTDPDGAIDHLIGLLPPELADASCWWQWTSSQSLPGREDTLSARLWYRSVEPLGDADLKRWAATANGSVKLIDIALYSPVQAHYIARPVFDGMTDPLPRRYGVHAGLEDEVSLILSPPDPKNPEVASGQGYAPGRGVQAYLVEIGGGHGFRVPIKSAVASYIAIHGSKADGEPLKAAIREAIDGADAGGRSTDEIERYRSDEYLDDLIRWTRERHGDQPPKGFQPEPPPHLDEPPPAEPPAVMGQGDAGVRREDFHAYMEQHNYIYAPTRAPWPGGSVNARLPLVPLFNPDGTPVLDKKGKQVEILPTTWLDMHRPVEQMTWAPGRPMIIRDRLISEGGWIERRKVSVFNLYRPAAAGARRPGQGRPLDRPCRQRVPGGRRTHSLLARASGAAPRGQDQSRLGARRAAGYRQGHA